MSGIFDLVGLDGLLTVAGAKDVGAVSPVEDDHAKGVFASKMTDVSNAERLATQHGEHLRYCHPRNSWFIWTGKVWEADRTGLVMHFARETVRNIYREAANTIDKDDREKLVGHALSSESNFRLTAMVEVAKSVQSLTVLPEQLDQNPWLLNVQNSVVDLRTGIPYPHHPSRLITRICNADFHQNAVCPLWDQFVLQVMGGDQQLVAYLQRLVGYCLTGIIREHVLVLFHGPGANGKSTFLMVVLDILGTYATMMPPEMLIAKRFGGTNSYDAAELSGIRLAIDSEVDEGRRFDVAKMKRLTGGDKVKARRPYENYIEFSPQYKMICGLNNLPTMPGSDAAAWRRVHLIPWSVVIPTTQQDPELKGKLLNERDGILKWALAGCLEWQKQGLNPPAAVVAATKEYRSEMDVIGGFTDACCVIDPKESCMAGELYTAYRTWCEAEGIYPSSQTQFGRDMRNRGFAKGKSRGTRRVTYEGIQIHDLWRRKADLPSQAKQQEAEENAVDDKPPVKSMDQNSNVKIPESVEYFVQHHVLRNETYVVELRHVFEIYERCCREREVEVDCDDVALAELLREVWKFELWQQGITYGFDGLRLEFPTHWLLDV